MTTTVTITGSGTPIMAAGRAGPGVAVEHGGQVLQFDCGRGTTMRLTEAGISLTDLMAVFVTHHHSDHLVGLADLLMSRWLEAPVGESIDRLPVVAPDGPASDIAAHLLDVWTEEMAMRDAHIGYRSRPEPEVLAFAPSPTPAMVFSRSATAVESVSVRHEPVVPAVAYRVITPDGVIVISGDTAICDEVENLAHGADVLVHEAFRTHAAQGLVSDSEAIGAYHSDPEAVGGLSARAGVGHLVLTHLIPPPQTEQDERAFVDDVRRGGFSGKITVARDLVAVRVPAQPPQ